MSYSLWHYVLESVSVLVFQSRHHDLPPLPPGGLQFEEGGGRGFPPLRQEHDEREWFEGVLKQALEVGDHAVHQLLAERRVGFKGTAQRLEVHYRSGTKRVVSCYIRKETVDSKLYIPWFVVYHTFSDAFPAVFLVLHLFVCPFLYEKKTFNFPAG